MEWSDCGCSSKGRSIDNRGDGLIDSHGHRLGKVFEAAVARLSRCRGSVVQGLNAAGASLDEIKDEQKRLNSRRKTVPQVRKRLENWLRIVVIQKAVKDIHSGIVEVREHVLSEVSGKLDGVPFETMESVATFSVNRELDTKRDVIAGPIERACEDLRKRLEEAEDHFRECLKGELGSDQPWYHLMNVRPQTLCKEQTDRLSTRLKKDTQGIVRGMTGWLGRRLNLSKARDKAVVGLKSRVGESLMSGLSDFEKHVERELNGEVDGALKEMEQHVTDLLKDIDARIGEQQNRQSSVEEERQRIRDEIKVIDESIEKVTKLQAEYDAARASTGRTSAER